MKYLLILFIIFIFTYFYLRLSETHINYTNLQINCQYTNKSVYKTESITNVRPKEQTLTYVRPHLYTATIKNVTQIKVTCNETINVQN